MDIKLAVGEALEWVAAQSQKSSAAEDASKRLSGIRRLLIYYAFKSGIIAGGLAKPKPEQIKACAQRIEKNLVSRKFVKANFAMNRKTIGSHLSAAFDELHGGKIAPSRQESRTTLLRNAQRLLVYAAYRKSLAVTSEAPWPVLSSAEADRVSCEMRQCGIAVDGDVQRLFNDAVEAVQP